jgi:hypothetical protein
MIYGWRLTIREYLVWGPAIGELMRIDRPEFFELIGERAT